MHHRGINECTGWRKLLFHILISALAMCGTSAAMAAFWDRSIEPVLVKPRLEAQWQSMDVSQRALSGRTKPEDWSGGVFVGNDAMGQVLQQLVGYKLEYVATDHWLTGTVLEVTRLAFEPDIGYGRARLALKAKKGSLELGLDLVGAVSYMGVQRASGDAGQDTVLAMIRIEPLEFSPTAKLAFWDFGLANFWTKLAPDLAVGLAKQSLFTVKIPLQDRFKFDIGMNWESKNEEVNTQTHARLKYRVTIPSTVLGQDVSYSAPVFRPEGLWLLAVQNESGQELVQARSAPRGSALAPAVEALRQQLDLQTKAFVADPATLGLWVSPAVVSGLAARLSALSDDKRRITIQTISSEGRLAEEKWRDDLLGEGGAYAELVDGQSAAAVIQIGKPQLTWKEGNFLFVLPADAQVSANIHIHFDPLIGGGAGTSVGMTGKGSGTLHMSGVPSLFSDESGLKLASLDTHLSCDVLKSAVTTDGVMKVDLGWISVPKLGAKFLIPVGSHQMGALSLLDNRPIFVETPSDDPRLVQDPSARATRITQSPWALLSPAPALKVRVVPEKLQADLSGIRAFVSLKAERLSIARTSDAVLKAREAIAAEAKVVAQRASELLKAQKAVADCAPDTEVAVLLGPIEIGPNNEVVKFAKNAWHDMTKGPGPNNELRKAVEALGNALPKLPDVTIRHHDSGGLGVQIGGWKF